MCAALTRLTNRCRTLHYIPLRRYSTSIDATLQVENAPAQQLSDIPLFRENAFNPEKPFHFKGHGSSRIREILPAATKWFTDPNTNSHPWPSPEPRTLSSYMDAHMSHPFPFELYLPEADSTANASSEAVKEFRDWLQQSQDFTDQIMAGLFQSLVEHGDGSTGTFKQFHAPLRLLKKALEFNQMMGEASREGLMLYIAQSSLDDLPPELKADVPAPQVVRQAGKGDIYASSIWLGTEPTYTPLHRDPNPNMFFQICSTKLVRLLPPDLGHLVFFEVMMRNQMDPSGAHMRSEDMMKGKEREALQDAIWNNENVREGKPMKNMLYEAQMDEGDALFIPRGWWHSIKSIGSSGGLNGSVNWWFR